MNTVFYVFMISAMFICGMFPLKYGVHAYLKYAHGEGITKKQTITRIAICAVLFASLIISGCILAYSNFYYI